MIGPVVELTDVAGLGPAKADKLKEAGITTVQELAQIDLRKPTDIGIRSETLKKFKADARKLLKANGIEFEKAPYGSGGAPTKAKATPKAAKATAKAAPKPAPEAAPKVTVSATASAADVSEPEEEKPKKGFFKRLLRL